jgi:hypothetical protein
VGYQGAAGELDLVPPEEELEFLFLLEFLSQPLPPLDLDPNGAVDVGARGGATRCLVNRA